MSEAAHFFPPRRDESQLRYGQKARKLTGPAVSRASQREALAALAALAGFRGGRRDAEQGAVSALVGPSARGGRTPAPAADGACVERTSDGWTSPSFLPPPPPGPG